MKNFKLVAAMLSALMLVLAFVPYALAEPDHGESITLMIDRRVMPQSILYPGRFRAPEFRREATVEVFNPVIRGYDGQPIEHLTIQTASGRTLIPIDTVKGIKLNNWVETRMDDIPHVVYTVNANILFTNGAQKQVLMNADFGTIEGKTDRGDFFLSDPHTVRYICFHRKGEKCEEEESAAPQASE